MTNYIKRYKLLKSKLKRVVFRVSTKYVYVQIIEYVSTGDIILKSISSKKYGLYAKNKDFCLKLGEDIGRYIENIFKTEELILDINRYFYTDKILYFIKGLKNVTEKVKINSNKINKKHESIL